MKKKLIFAAAAIAMLASCSQNDLEAPVVGQTQQSDAIEFGTYLGKQATSRAGTIGEITTTTLTTGAHKDAGFGVIAYNTGATDWAGTSNAVTPNFMYNQQVKYNSSTSAWEYSPIKYWPNGTDAANADNSPSNTATEDGVQEISFFAYAPYVDLSSALTGNGITKVNNSTTLSDGAGTGNLKIAEPTVNYTLKNTDIHAAANVDLLWGVRGDAIYSETDNTDNTAGTGIAYNVNLTKENVAEKVNFLFKHALAKVGGYNGLKIVADVDGNGGAAVGYGTLDGKTCITVRQITIQNASVATNYSGVFNLATGAWSDLAGGTPTKGGLIDETIKDGTSSITMNTAIYDEDGTPTYDTGTNKWSPLGVTTTAKNIYNSDTQDGFYLIPGSTLQLEITVNYDVTTYDPNINGSYVKTNQVITNTVTLPNTLASNKFYTLVLHLGLTSVKFSAEVAAWDEETAGTETEVWLPSNVVEYTTATTVAAGANATVNATAATTSYTINLTGLKASTNLTVVTPDGTYATDADQDGSTDSSGNAVVDVTLDANTSTSNTHNATVTIKGIDSSDHEFTTVVTIIQEKAYTTSTTLASGNSTAVYAAKAGGSYTINMTGLTNDGKYTVESSNTTMATVDPLGTASNTGTAAIAVTLTANTGSAVRSASITITDVATGTTSVVVINQIP